MIKVADLVAPGLHQRRHLDRDEPAHGDQLGAERAHLRRRRLRLPRVSFLNKCDEAERPLIAEYYQRVFGEDLPGERGRQGLAEARSMAETDRPLPPRAGRAQRGRSRRIREVEVVLRLATSRPRRARPRACRSPGRRSSRRLVAEARGAADSLALRLRYHDARAPCARRAHATSMRAPCSTRSRRRGSRRSARARWAASATISRSSTEARVRGDAIVRARDRRGSAAGDRGRR